MENNIEVKVEGNTKELVLRKGEAKPVVPFRKGVSVVGDLSTPFCYLKNAPNWFDTPELDVDVTTGSPNLNIDTPLDYSELYVNEDEGSLKLIVDAGSVWQSSYTGILAIDPVFKLFKINTGHQFSTFELAELFKMNRSHFETKDVAMKLVNELTKFKATINKIIEDADDSRGNKTVLHAQAVESNIPAAFNLNIPIFKGNGKFVIEIEVAISARDLTCTLISPEANDIINDTKAGLIDEQLKLIEGIYPNLKVFNV